MAIDSIKVEEIQPDGSKKDVKIDRAAQGYHNYLVMFNAVIDLDLAMLKMIQAEYNNPKYIDQKVMGLSIRELKYLLINRTDQNPLSVCIHNKTVADNIYKEIMSTRYFDLLSSKYLSITSIFFLISVYAAMENVHVSIVCSNEQEEAVIRKYHSKVNVIVPKQLPDIDVNEYTEFIFKSKDDVFKFKQVYKEKRIILLGYKFNVVNDGNIVFPDPKVSGMLWYSGFSKAVIADVYSRNDDDFAELLFAVKKKPEN